MAFVYRRAGRFPFGSSVANSWRFGPIPPPTTTTVARGMQSRPGRVFRAAAVAFTIVINPVVLEVVAAEDPPQSRGFVARPIPSPRMQAIQQGHALAVSEPLPKGTVHIARPAPPSTARPFSITAGPPPAEVIAPEDPAGLRLISRSQPPPGRAAPSAYFSEGRIPPPTPSVEALPEGWRLISQAELQAGRAAVGAYQTAGRIPPPDSLDQPKPAGRGFQARWLPAAPRSANLAYDSKYRMPPPEVAPIGPLPQSFGFQSTPGPRRYAATFSEGRFIRPGPVLPSDEKPVARGFQARPQLGKARAASYTDEIRNRVPGPRLEILGTGVIAIARPIQGPKRASSSLFGRIPPPDIDVAPGDLVIAVPTPRQIRATPFTYQVALPVVAIPEVLPSGVQSIATPPVLRRTPSESSLGRLPMDAEAPPEGSPVIAQRLWAAQRASQEAYETVTSTEWQKDIQPLPAGQPAIGRRVVTPRSPVAYDTAGRIPPPDITTAAPVPVAVSPPPFGRFAKVQDFAFGQIPPPEIGPLPPGALEFTRPLPQRLRPFTFIAFGLIPSPAEPIPQGSRALSTPQLAQPRGGALVAVLTQRLLIEELLPLPTSGFCSSPQPVPRPARAQAAFVYDGRIPPEITALPPAGPVVSLRLWAGPRPAPEALGITGRIPPPDEVFAEPLPGGAVAVSRWLPSMRAAVAAYETSGRIPPPDIELGLIGDPLYKFRAPIRRRAFTVKWSHRQFTSPEPRRRFIAPGDI